MTGNKSIPFEVKLSAFATNSHFLIYFNGVFLVLLFFVLCIFLILLLSFLDLLPGFGRNLAGSSNQRLLLPSLRNFIFWLVFFEGMVWKLNFLGVSHWLVQIRIDYVEYESGVIKSIVPRLLLVWLLVGKQDFEVLVHLIVFQTPAADIGLLEFIGFEQKQLSYAHK